MEYLVILKEETNQNVKKFNDIKRWFVNNFNKNLTNFNFVYENDVRLDLIKSNRFFIVGPNTFPMLNSNSLESFHKSNINFTCGDRGNCIGFIVLRNLLDKKSEMSKVSSVKYNDLWEILRLIPDKKSGFLNDWNEGNTRSSGWFYVDDKRIVNFLSFLLNKYFTWANINKIKLNIANRYPKVIYYEGKNKLESKKLMESIDINCPKTYKVFDNLNEITQEDVNNLPDCIIKPTNRDGSKMILKNLKRNPLKVLQIREGLNGFERKNAGKELMPLISRTHKPKVIAEEYITDLNGGRSAPCEFKFYVFSGKILFLLAINRKAAYNKFDFYDENFVQFPNTRYSYEKTQHNNKWPEIKFFGQLKEDVYRIYRRFNEDMKDSFLGRFVRIDFFVTSNNYWFGEFSLFPNGAYGGNLNTNGKLKWIREWLPEVFNILEGTPIIPRNVEENPVVEEKPVVKKQVIKNRVNNRKKKFKKKPQYKKLEIQPIASQSTEKSLTDFIFSQLPSMRV